MLNNKTILTILAILFLAGCAQELDETSITIEKEEPEVVDAFFISSIVLDEETEVPLEGVPVKFISDSQEMETLTNSSGEFFFEVPNEVLNGNLYLYKEEYFPILLDYTQGEEVSKSIFMHEDEQNSSNPIESFEDIFTIKGQFVYPNGSPATDVKYEVYSPSSDVQAVRLVKLGSFLVDEEGKFTIVGDSLSIRPNITIVGQSIWDRCTTTGSYSLKVNTSATEVDPIIYDRVYEDVISTNVTADDCLQGLTSKAYLINQLPIRLCNQPLGNIDIPYCPNVPANILYVGVENASGDFFDGVFVQGLSDGSKIDFKPCVPVVKFFELTRGGITELKQATYDTLSNRFIFEDPDISLTFDIEEQYTNIVDGTECNPGDLHFSTIRNLEYVDLNNPGNNYSQQTDLIFMDNVENSEDWISGILMSINNEIRIRFRAIKS